MTLVLENNRLRDASKKGLIGAFLLLIAQVIPYIDHFNLWVYLHIPHSPTLEKIMLYGPDIIRVIGFLYLLYFFSTFMYSFHVFDETNTERIYSKIPVKTVIKKKKKVVQKSELSLDEE